MTDKLEAQLRALVPNTPLTRLSQGAEAIVYRSPVHPYLDSSLDLLHPPSATGSYIVKYRPPKPYRHAVLDASLTKHRTLAEARLLVKLGNLGVNVPRLIGGDFRKGVIWMEDVGPGNGEEGDTQTNSEEYDSGSNGSVKVWIWEQEKIKQPGSIEVDEIFKQVLKKVGAEVGKLHLFDVVHGDLTTSNIMLRPSSPSKNSSHDLEPVLIDFGLGSQSTLPEDKAVDLYVLERAVISTHPIHSDIYNKWLLEGYTEFFESSPESKKLGGGKKIRDIIRKLEDVRMRGRKRSMEG